MPELAIRFTVQFQGRQRAATWKCWSPSGKEDIYLTCRELGGALKISLHESGKWHTAYFEGFFKSAVPKEYQTDAGRFIDQWNCPEAIAPGVTLAVRIVTPWSSITAHGEMSTSIVSVPPPAEGKAIECGIFLIDRSTPMTDWPGKKAMNTELIGSYELPSGNSVWVVWWEINMPKLNPLHGSPKFYHGHSMEDLKTEHVRMLMFGDVPDGSKVIYDCVAKYEKRST